ncbi:SDR family oxidoreductase [Candidatus Gracilibacteria bacterium]|nr:SDR family oxidoreductase [Candidatus Gracilibacteria bacterium]
MKKYALITGASSGIGLAFTEIFAKDHINLVLVARSIDALKSIQSHLQNTYNIDVHVIEKDLSKIESVEEVFEYTESQNLQIDYLVNNAGFGDYGNFVESDISRNTQMISLNTIALTNMCRLYSETMKKHKFGRILNIASTAAFQPGPYMAVYFATKSYVLSFSLALSTELKEFGVTVSTLCPGPTESKFELTANATGVSLFSGKLPTSHEVALFGYKKMLKGKKVAIHGIINNIKAQSVKFLPMNIRLFMMKLIMKR